MFKNWIHDQRVATKTKLVLHLEGQYIWRKISNLRKFEEFVNEANICLKDC